MTEYPLPPMAPTLPFLTADLPGIGGALRSTDDDFAVEEVPAYQPGGEGDHVFVWIEKRGLSTFDAVAALARALDVKPGDVGTAGLKDKRAVTRQFLSLPPPVTPEAALAVELEGLAVLSATRHPNKLRTGHLRGNRFTLRVRELACDADEAAARAGAILARLAASPGCPNWFGAQRFGRSGDNAQAGRRIVRGEAGKKGPRNRQRRLLVSAYQSELFNDYLRQRMDEGTAGRVLAGDLLQVRASGGIFASGDPDTDQARVDAGELALTGPMFGSKMKAPPEGSEASAREAALLEREGLSPGDFRHLGKIALGTRRALGVLVEAPEARPAEGGAVDLSFTLPSGSYATAVMREVMKTDRDFPG